jgi:UDP-glucuronate decarboxylase
VVSNFVLQALRGEPITIYGDGAQTRSFCYVDDLVDGLVRLMACADAVGQPVNLGNPAESTINELAEAICRLVGTELRRAPQALPVDDPRRRCPDIGLAQRLFSWTPATALETGLRATIDYFASTAPKDRPA